jgi:hypothetical protein
VIYHCYLTVDSPEFADGRYWKILLQKSAATDLAVGRFVKSRGFDALA